MNTTIPDEIETEEILWNKAIHFPSGIPGFASHHEFVLAQQPDERPFAWLQSVSDPNLAFAVVDAYAWCKDFTLEVDDAVLLEMGSLNPIDYAVYFILQIGKQDERATFQAKPNVPIIVNIRNRQARQVIIAPNSSVEKAEALCLLL